MPNKQNNKKRNSILKATYELITENGYSCVTTQNIAEKSGISKSLLQKYYPKKNDIFKCILKNILITSFEYIDIKFSDQQDIYRKLSAVTWLFFQNIITPNVFNKNMVEMMSDNELKDVWLDVLLGWIIEMNDDELSSISTNKIEVATRFSFAGGAELAIYCRKLKIDGCFITEKIISSFMRSFTIKDKRISEVTSWLERTIDDVMMDDFGKYCTKFIAFYQ